MQNGIEVYATTAYPRIRFSHYIEMNRIADNTAGKLLGKLVNYKWAIIFIEATQISPNSPIKIKKYVRTPGNRKLVKAFQKRQNCYVNFVDDLMRSQHCGWCFKRYPWLSLSRALTTCNHWFQRSIPWLYTKRRSASSQSLGKLICLIRNIEFHWMKNQIKF